MKVSGSLWQYYRDEPVLNDNNVIIGFPTIDNNSNLLKIKQKMTEHKGKDGNKNVERMVP